MFRDGVQVFHSLHVGPDRRKGGGLSFVHRTNSGHHRQTKRLLRRQPRVYRFSHEVWQRTGYASLSTGTIRLGENINANHTAMAQLVDHKRYSCLDLASAPAVAPGVAMVTLSVVIGNEEVWFGERILLRVLYKQNVQCSAKVSFHKALSLHFDLHFPSLFLLLVAM